MQKIFYSFSHHFVINKVLKIMYIYILYKINLNLVFVYCLYGFNIFKLTFSIH